MIKSFELEKKVLAGLLQHPQEWSEVSSFLVEEDFYSEESKVHVTLFKMIRNAYNNKEAIDDTILIDRLSRLNATFPDSIDRDEYIRALVFNKISKEVFLNSVKELKKYTFRRKTIAISNKIENFAKTVDPSKPYSFIVEEIDRIYNNEIRSFEMGESRLVNLAEIAEEIIEQRGDNPPEEVGAMSPYPTINKIYGSLVRPGNCTCFAARAKTGKTSLMLDMLLKMSYMNKLPILHFDNGEMSEEELVFRMVSGMSGIPVYLLESGKWRTHGYKNLSPQETVERVRAVWDRMKGIKILYENVAGMGSEEMVSLLKRIYYSEVGRGNELIFSFDYLKTDFNNLGKGADWAFVGKLLHNFKQTISRELKFDGKPTVAMVTSVQTNRSGIVTNRNADTVVDDESVIALSDNIIQFVSHLFLLRKKTMDELVQEGEAFGTHKLKCLAARHLGEDAFGHLNPVEWPDGSKRDNWINLKFDNFNVEERGDGRDVARMLEGSDVQAQVSRGSELELPESLR